MSQQTPSGAGMRGAVDLSAMQAQPGPGAPAGGGAPAGASGGAGPGTGSLASPGAVAGRRGLVVEGSDTTFTEVMNGSVSVPMVMVVWSPRLPESRDYLDTVISVARTLDGRTQVVSVDIDANPGLHRALQIQSVPVTLGLVQGQPVPLFVGVQDAPTVRGVLDQLLTMAVQNGLSGRVDLAGESEGAATGEGEEAELPPLHQEAYDAIDRGDLVAAAAAYQAALTQNPADTEAKLGLAQVGLMQRTDGVDLQQARDAAAAHPLDVAAQTLVADLDLLGGHVEDAFTRLIDLVRETSGDERAAARAHLIELFEVVGNHDERVRKGRTALMSALF